MSLRARRSVLAILLGILVFPSSGCVPAQVARMKAPESKAKQDVYDAVVAVLKERYYQVRSYQSTGHVVALTPIFFDGNQLSRKKIDVFVFLENGYYMPKIWVRKFIDTAEPEMQKGPITGRFPVEVNGYPAAADNWRELYYDRTEEQEIRKAILERLKII